MPSRQPRVLSAAVACVIIALPPAVASAEPPPPPLTAPTDAAPGRRSFVELEGGYAWGGFQAGVGARVGTTFASGFHVAASLTVHPQQNLPLYADTSPPTLVHQPARLVYMGPEIGYDADLRYIIVRPYVGVGLGVQFEGMSDASVAVWAGLEVQYGIPRSRLFVAVGLRAAATSAEGDVFAGGVGVFGVFGVQLGS